MFKWLVILLLLAGVRAPVLAEDVAVRIGNPLLARYPASGDARPRSIWDLHTFNDRLYLGHGDYWNDSGPTDIWIYQGDGTHFVKEYTADEEMVWDFFEYDNQLFIPGIDAMESWDFANLYINDPQREPDPGWLKLRTLPEGRHSFEVALFQSNLYASITRSDYTGRTFVSSNMGQTWTTLLPQHSQFVVFDDFLFLEGNIDYIYRNGTLQQVTPSMIAYTLNTARKVRFKAGVLYSLFPRYQLNKSPLYFISGSQITNSGVATAIPAFTNAKVRDIVVRDDVCYVMTAEEVHEDLEYQGRIYASSDLTNWPLAVHFTVPGIPLSFEVMSNKFYVGLGSRFDGEDWDILYGPEAGSIWQLTPTPHFENLDPLIIGEVTLDMGVVPGFDFTINATPSLVQPVWTTVITTNTARDFFIFTDTNTANESSRYYRVFH